MPRGTASSGSADCDGSPAVPRPSPRTAAQARPWGPHQAGARPLTLRVIDAPSPNQDDRREELLSLTPEGRGIYDALVPQALAFEERVLSVLDPHELETLSALMDKLSHHARSMAPEEGSEA